MVPAFLNVLHLQVSQSSFCIFSHFFSDFLLSSTATLIVHRIKLQMKKEGSDKYTVIYKSNALFSHQNNYLFNYFFEKVMSLKCPLFNLL